MTHYNQYDLANKKVSKIQLHKIRLPGKFLGRLLGPLLKTGLSLIGNVLKPLAKCFNIIRFNSSSISNRCSYLNEIFWIWYNDINNFEWRNESYHENN